MSRTIKVGMAKNLNCHYFKKIKECRKTCELILTWYLSENSEDKEMCNQIYKLENVIIIFFPFGKIII